MLRQLSQLSKSMDSPNLANQFSTGISREWALHSVSKARGQNRKRWNPRKRVPSSNCRGEKSKRIAANRHCYGTLSLPSRQTCSNTCSCLSCCASIWSKNHARHRIPTPLFLPHLAFSTGYTSSAGCTAPTTCMHACVDMSDIVPVCQYAPAPSPPPPPPHSPPQATPWCTSHHLIQPLNQPQLADAMQHHTQSPAAPQTQGQRDRAPSRLTPPRVFDQGVR